jgi:Fe-S cluster assembly ATPase SufC
MDGKIHPPSSTDIIPPLRRPGGQPISRPLFSVLLPQSSVILKTHDRKEAFEIATRILVMANGGIVKSGSVETIRHFFQAVTDQ